MPTGEWLWEVWPLLLTDEDPTRLAVGLTSDTPFDPKHRRYANDLAVLMGYAVVVGK